MFGSKEDKIKSGLKKAAAILNSVQELIHQDPKESEPERIKSRIEGLMKALGAKAYFVYLTQDEKSAIIAAECRPTDLMEVREVATKQIMAARHRFTGDSSLINDPRFKNLPKGIQDLMKELESLSSQG